MTRHSQGELVVGTLTDGRLDKKSISIIGDIGGGFDSRDDEACSPDFKHIWLIKASGVYELTSKAAD